jgi:hypothetical protein
MMCDVSVSFTHDIGDCQAACRDCKAFTYLQNGGVCQVFHDDLCVDMLNSLGKNHYIKHCHKTGKNGAKITTSNTALKVVKLGKNHYIKHCHKTGKTRQKSLH